MPTTVMPSASSQSRMASSPEVTAENVRTSLRRRFPLGTRTQTFTSTLLMSIPATRSWITSIPSAPPPVVGREHAAVRRGSGRRKSLIHVLGATHPGTCRGTPGVLLTYGLGTRQGDTTSAGRPHTDFHAHRVSPSGDRTTHLEAARPPGPQGRR